MSARPHQFRVGDRVRVHAGHLVPVIRKLTPGRWCFATVIRADSYEVKVRCDSPFAGFKFTIAVPDESAIVHLGLLEQLAEAATPPEEPPNPPKRRS